MLPATMLPPATRADVARSRELARRIDGRNGECYRNSILALQADPEFAEAGGVYVEGLVLTQQTGFWPMGHAWLELPDGSVVDPTPTYCKAGAPEARYFGAFRWDRDACWELVTVPRARYTFRLRLPDEGRRMPAWRAAAHAACSTAQALALAEDGRLLAPEWTTLEDWIRMV